jgi:hypothetical protein
MKRVKFAAAIALCLAMGQAFAAQDCTTPTALTQAGVSGVNGCLETNTVPTFCVFNTNPSPDVIFSFTLGAGFTATKIHLTTTTGTYQPQMVLQQACGSTSDCVDTANAAAAGGAADLTLTGKTAGAYFLAVGGTSTSVATDCGTFSLSLDGTLPVQLQKFSVD